MNYFVYEVLGDLYWGAAVLIKYTSLSVKVAETFLLLFGVARKLKKMHYFVDEVLGDLWSCCSERRVWRKCTTLYVKLAEARLAALWDGEEIYENALLCWWSCWRLSCGLLFTMKRWRNALHYRWSWQTLVRRALWGSKKMNEVTTYTLLARFAKLVITFRENVSKTVKFSVSNRFQKVLLSKIQQETSETKFQDSPFLQSQTINQEQSKKKIKKISSPRLICYKRPYCCPDQPHNFDGFLELISLVLCDFFLIVVWNRATVAGSSRIKRAKFDGHQSSQVPCKTFSGH